MADKVNARATDGILCLPLIYDSQLLSLIQLPAALQMGLKDRKRGGGEKWGRNYEQKREIESEQENKIQMDGREKSKTGNTQDAERATSRKKPNALLPLCSVYCSKK